MLYSSSGQRHELKLVSNEKLVVLMELYLTKCVRLVMNRKVSCCLDIASNNISGNIRIRKKPKPCEFKCQSHKNEAQKKTPKIRIVM